MNAESYIIRCHKQISSVFRKIPTTESFLFFPCVQENYFIFYNFSKVALKNKRRRENAKKRQEENAANPPPAGAAPPAAQQNGAAAKPQSNGNKGNGIDIQRFYSHRFELDEICLYTFSLRL